MLNQAFEALKTFDWGADPKLLSAIDQAVVDTQGDADQRAVLESRLAAVLDDDISRDAVDYVCRKLMQIGTAKSVPALAKRLTNEETSHMARFALDRIPDAEAGDALRSSLADLQGPLLVGVIGSLGVRRENASVKPVAALLDNRDSSVAIAAAKALGNIGTPDAGVALLGGKATPAITDALFRCAESFLADKHAKAALTLYSALSGKQHPQHVRLAAMRGKLMCAGA